MQSASNYPRVLPGIVKGGIGAHLSEKLKCPKAPKCSRCLGAQGSDGEMKEEKVPPSERGNSRRRSARLTRERRLPDRMRARKTRIRVKGEGRREKGEGRREGGPRDGECVGLSGLVEPNQSIRVRFELN
ncbi:hypothetical protein B296_00012142 [Ensete ventricosum]|uniref:Uncharacterized protein n=1 Tax=Ensete ventricosum TaxID=4639 RepID=A0A427A6V0_ENSVE|nr:hypothetical protein B296_00012142 [Ensete ventricosum]